MQTSLGVMDASVDLLHMCLVLIARHILSNQIVTSAVGHLSVLFVGKMMHVFSVLGKIKFIWQVLF